jgi:hypothetical protein
MNRRAHSDQPVQVAETQSGIITYLVAQPPEALPPVPPRELERAWYDARAAAIAEQDGPARLFRFRRGEGAHTDLALTDTDARCWAAAVDSARGIDNLLGLSVCLRLLALVDLMTRARWVSAWVALLPDGAEIDPVLLRAASTSPLTHEARFDEHALHAQVCGKVLAHQPTPAARPMVKPDSRPSGVSV